MVKERTCMVKMLRILIIKVPVGTLIKDLKIIKLYMILKMMMKK